MKNEGITDAALLREFRERHKLSQSQAAKLCNTPLRTWQGWEGEGREPPDCLWRLIHYIDRYGKYYDQDVPPRVRVRIPGKGILDVAPSRASGFLAQGMIGSVNERNELVVKDGVTEADVLGWTRMGAGDAAGQD